jgi:hypothetical protein
MKMDTDEEITEAALSEPWRHAIIHAGNVDEHDDIHGEIQAMQEQLDSLHALVIRVASALNTVLPVPIELDQ